MPKQPSARKPAAKQRKAKALSRARVLEAALRMADERGVEALSMRKLSQALGVEAMSLYNHVANKDEILDGIVELVMGEIPAPDAKTPWRKAMLQRAQDAHRVLLSHPWAATLIESRSAYSPVRLSYFDAVLANLLHHGFGVELAYHAFLTLDSFVYGFTMQEVSWPFEAEERGEHVEAMSADFPADDYPHIAQVMAHIVGSDAKGKPDYAAEFAFGLDLLLDGLARAKRKR